MPEDDGTTLPGVIPGEKRDPPPPPPPPPAFLFAAISLGLAGLIYIIKTLCEWFMGNG